jgi:hypothetical protein
VNGVPRLGDPRRRGFDQEASVAAVQATPAAATLTLVVEWTATATDPTPLPVRFGGQRPGYFHPAVAPILDSTGGLLFFRRPPSLRAIPTTRRSRLPAS